MTFLIWLLVFCVVLPTTLPLLSSTVWWVRMWDFPRVHILFLAAFTLVIVFVLQPQFQVILMGVLLVCATHHAILIFPYTSFAKTEVSFITPSSPEDNVKLMAVNVLMENDRFKDLERIIAREDPDILFLMETDERWKSALADTVSQYAHVSCHIADDHYGMIFATRLPVQDAQFFWPNDDNTPALRATLTAPDGTVFEFSGLHPRPPVPGNDTKVRDRQTKNMGKRAHNTQYPTICMGDFNDVAWSATTRRFKREGGFLEPRIGRGMLSSFHAEHLWMRFPIDQLYITPDVGLVSFNRLEYFGSDHFPMQATIAFTRQPAKD